MNAGVDEDNYNIDGSSNDWVVTPYYNGSANTVSVYPKAANTGSAAKTFTFKVVHGDDASLYKEISCSQAMSAPLTIADILAGGAKTYAGTTDELLVYAVSGSNVIVGDNSGKMILFKSGHGLAAGDILTITNAVTSVYQNVVLEITGGTFNKKSSGNQVSHGAHIGIDDATTCQAQVTAFSAEGFHSAVYVAMIGNQSGKNINGSNAKLYLNQANSATDGKMVETYGYVYAYSSGYSNFYYQAVSIEEYVDADTPSLSVDPTSITWAADETTMKTITVTTNSAASGYTVSSAASGWSVNDNGSGTISVCPNAVNTSTTADKTMTLTITHKDDTSISKQVTLTQSKVLSGPAWSRVTSVEDLLAGGTCILGYEATANSGVIVPMANTGSATTSAAGFMYSGSTAASGGSGTINMATVTETSKFEVTIVASTTVSNAICIKVGNNFIGNTNTKNNHPITRKEV